MAKEERLQYLLAHGSVLMFYAVQLQSWPSVSERRQDDFHSWLTDKISDESTQACDAWFMGTVPGVNQSGQNSTSAPVTSGGVDGRSTLALRTVKQTLPDGRCRYITSNENVEEEMDES